MNWFLEWISNNKGRFTGLVIGLAVAILFLTIGFWATLLIGVCTGVGGWLGAHPEARTALAEFFGSIFTGGKGRFTA